MKVIITGAGGFIGRTLSMRLLEKGVIVYGIDISSKGFLELEKKENFYPIIIKNHDILSQLDFLKGEKINAFYHLGWGGSLLSEDLNNFTLQISNIQMSMNYLEKINELGIKKIIFGSSSYQYLVDNNCNMLSSYYGMAKRAVEDMFFKYCYTNHLECNIAILTNTFGVGDYSMKAVNTIMIKMIKNEEISLISGEYPNDWVYIDDTVEGLISVLSSKKTYQKYYIGHHEISTFKDKIIQMAKYLNYQNELVFGKYDDSVHVDYSMLNTDTLLKDTGFECRVSFEYAVKLTKHFLEELI